MVVKQAEAQTALASAKQNLIQLADNTKELQKQVFFWNIQEKYSPLKFSWKLKFRRNTVDEKST